MKKKNFLVKRLARNVQVMNQDLRDMQLEMAENLVVFAYQHIANSTGCPSVDFILDVCYTWIATEQGILKPGFRSFLYS